MAANEYSHPGMRQPANGAHNGQFTRSDPPAAMTAMGSARSAVPSSQAQSAANDSMPPGLRSRSQPNAAYPPDLQAGAPNGYPAGNGSSDARASQSRHDMSSPMAGHPGDQHPLRAGNGGRAPVTEYRPPVNILPQSSSLDSPKLLPARRPSANNLDEQAQPFDGQPYRQPMRGLQANGFPTYPVAQPGAANAPASYSDQGHAQGAMRGSIPRQQSLVYSQQGLTMSNPPAAAYIKQSTFSGIMRLLQMGQSLTSAIAQPGLAALESWVYDYFTSDAYIRFKLADNAVPIADYEIPSCTLARFYSTLRDSGVCSFQLLLDSPSEALAEGTNAGRSPEQLVQCQSISWIVGYTSGSTAVSRGKLRAIFVPTGNTGPGGVAIRMRRLEWSLSMHRQLVDRDFIKRRMLVNGSVSAMSPLPYSKQGTSPVELDSGSSPMKEDPGASAPIPSQSRKRPRLDYEDSRDMQSSSPQKAQNFVRGVDYATGANYEELSLPPSIDGLGGLNPDILQVLETGSLMDKLGELLAFSMKQHLGPIDALQKYAELCMPMLPPSVAQMNMVEALDE